MPHLLVLGWLIYVGTAVWLHALHSVQPPLYDPIGYVQKAMNFWREVELGHTFNPLNLVPTVRPPGTILMSYPLGFSKDFHGFHFRSVFLAIACIVAAVYLAVGGTGLKRQAGWVGAMALLLGSLPQLYYFDWIEETGGPVRWGLVDNFQGGVAALAVAALVRSLMNRSSIWLLLAAGLASFTLLIKPSGLMIMALLALLWIIVVGMEWLRTRRLGIADTGRLPYTIKSGTAFLLVYGSTVALCIFSGYFSEANFSYAKQALVIMNGVLQVPLRETLALFHQSSGEALVVWLVVVGGLFIYYLPAAGKVSDVTATRALGLLVGSLAVLVLGAWYWKVIQAGGNQIRYFFPFLLMGAIAAIPSATKVWAQANRPIRAFLMLLCIAPAINIGLLLAAGDNPPATWQKMAGVSVSVGVDQEEVQQAKTFVEELRTAQKSARVYSFGNGILPAVFENVGMLEEIINPELANFSVIRPKDWLRGFAVRTEELQQCDYILIRKRGRTPPRRALPEKPADSFQAEQNAFENWLTTIDKQSGIEIVSDGRVLRLLRVTDSRAFDIATNQFVAGQTWRPEFIAANPPAFWSREAVFAYTNSAIPDDITFGSTYRLHALSIRHVAQQIVVEIWWEELRPEKDNQNRFFFMHLLDASGAMIGNQQIALYPYLPLAEDRRWRFGTATFDEQHAAALAFGIYQPPDVFLLPDKGHSDWEGRRVIIPIDGAPGAQVHSTGQQ